MAIRLSKFSLRLCIFRQSFGMVKYSRHMCAYDFEVLSAFWLFFHLHWRGVFYHATKTGVVFFSGGCIHLMFVCPVVFLAAVDKRDRSTNGLFISQKWGCPRREKAVFDDGLDDNVHVYRCDDACFPMASTKFP
ncbi:hypothetical protein B0T21DRAFT_167657 [Apiosordaria backusii]|uniref:Uncharacterized protein n=1 Tax=Apiosordaria backusii TaxID=314023 RepID=A0AA40BNM0_9PEZI|nr:hypothetical protein B0T21DRAFT_167657 [Apiosordaria backusii]